MAIEMGVDEATLDEALDLRRMAAGFGRRPALGVRPDHVVQLGEPSSGRPLGEGAVGS